MSRGIKVSEETRKRSWRPRLCGDIEMVGSGQI